MVTFLLYDKGELIRVFSDFDEAERQRKLREQMRKRSGIKVDIRIERRHGTHRNWFRPLKEILNG